MGKTRRVMLGGPPHNLDADAETAFRIEFARAFANWQAIEHELGFIFSYLVAAKNPQIAWKVYQSIIGFRVKVEMIDAAAQFILPLRPSLMKKWVTLRDPIKRRNQLAHYDYLYAPDKKTGKYIPFLLPYGQIDPADVITKSKVESWADSFLALASKLYDLRAALLASGLYDPKQTLPPSPYK